VPSMNVYWRSRIRCARRPWHMLVQALVIGLCSIIATHASAQRAQSGSTSLSLTPTGFGLGVLEGDPTQEFGAIGAVSVRDDGIVLVLDSRLSRLWAYRSGGQVVAGIGRAGSGPGEFRVATSMATLSDGAIAVLDHSLARFSFFELRGDSLAFMRSFQLLSPARDFCFFGGILYVAGSGSVPSGVITRFGMDGTEQGSFGGLFGDEKDAYLANILSLRLRIACVPNKEIVLIASEWLPEVRAYHGPSGRLLWTTKASQFEQTDIIRVGTAVQFKPPPSQSIHKVDRLLPLEKDIIAVQLERMWRTATDGPVQREYALRLIDAETGFEIGVQTGLPQILEVANTLAFVADTTDFPRLLGVRIRVDARP